MYSSEAIEKIIPGEVVLRGKASLVQRVLLDSRKISQPKDSIFIAIKGERHDSHRYLKDVYDAGVRTFIIEHDADLSELQDANVIRVKSSISALQLIAAHHRKQFDIPTIGITGSNGKTIVKEWLNTMLADDFNIVRSPKSWNSQVGVPLSVLNIENTHTLGIFEAGISQPGEMEKLAKVIQPTIGIFTSIGSAHSENFLSRRQLIGEKLNLFAPAEIVICPADGELIQLISTWAYTKRIVLVPQVERATVGVHNNVTTVKLRWNNSEHEFDIPFTDKASLENAITCIYCLFVLKYDASEIQSRLQRLMALEMRLQLLDGQGDSVIVNDAYSNDLQSLEIALDFLQQHARGRKKIVILSDIMQSGLNEQDLHGRIHSLLKSKNISQVIGIGSSMMKNVSLYENSLDFYSSTEEFLQKINANDFSHSALLVKGARHFRFERIVSLLQEKTHDTVLEVDLAALTHNLNYFRSKLKRGVKTMVMVKASGYGSGSHEVASLLEFSKVDYLAVAYTDEGVELRKSGISLPIMVMNAERSSMDVLIKHNLQPEIYSMRNLQHVMAAIETYGGGLGNKVLPVHIKLDTGMHRLGFIEEDISSLCETLKESSLIKVVSVFTHLAATDERQHDEFTQEQLKRFYEMCDVLRKELDYDFLLHALNTAGIQRFPDAQLDMVRLGIGLYGVAPHTEDQKHLQSVGTLKTVISQIRNISKGESIGYSRKYVATSDITIAIVPMGYADGLRRSLSNGVGEMLVKNTRCKIVGNVCMDMTMIDITSLDALEGDEVIVLGNEITLKEFAQKCGTIEYEILTSISQRVKRIYVSG
ncbi:MAG: bifunctional UDP-N-acetylmuramoyl-tripeptide:D-alanyl-D-alanine ligase/alanine racemase [Flavobacteriales bacterium]|nr:bifunctional UDP-N-acetylmuramoyl-tripeptide:D-alanyl-D-alanine ligase/alanine racemase [Flavobacteriales bacterium]